MDVSVLTIAQQSEVLDRHEGHFFDFKRSAIEPAKLQNTVVAFANADGGDAYVGVDDDRSLPPDKRLYGFDTEESANAHLQALEHGIEPPIAGLSADFLRFPADTAQLVMRVTVPKSAQAHYTAKKECYIRKGAQNLVLRGVAVQRLVFTKGSQSFEDTPCDAIRVRDLEEGQYVHEYLHLVPTAQPVSQFLRKQRLIESEAQQHFRGPRVLVAGVLLLDDAPQAALSTKCAVKITRLETSATEYSRDFLAATPATIEGPIAVQIDKAVGTVSDIMQSATFTVAGQYRKLRYPTEAIHEVVTNAILHRDYSIKDDVHVFVYDNRIEVISPGRLPGHVTVANILQERFARNPKIVRGVNRLPDPPNRDIGEGLNTAFQRMREARLKDPVIEELENAVRVTLKHESIASPDAQVVEYLRSHTSISNREGRNISGIRSENTMKNVFSRLLKAGVLEPVDRNSSRFDRRYRLAPDWEMKWNEPPSAPT